MDSVSADVPKHLALAVEVKDQAKGVQKIMQDFEDNLLNLDTAEGMSFLELKNHLMLTYLTNLSYIMLKKCSGKSIAGDDALERLVTVRTIMEKLRPIESKLKYQINKAVKTADQGEVNADDPMHFKANPALLVSKLGESDEEDEDDDEEDEGDQKNTKTNAKYVAPKHVPAFFDDGTTNKEDEKEKRDKKHLLSKGLIEELKRQHLETPEEIHERDDVMKRRHVDAMKERIRYEEENFMRLPLTKKTKHSRRQMSTMGTIADELTSFGRNHFSSNDGLKKRKRSSTGKGLKKSSAKKRFKR